MAKRKNPPRKRKTSELFALQDQIALLEVALADSRETNHYQSAMQNHDIALISMREDLRVIKDCCARTATDLATIRGELCKNQKWHKAFHAREAQFEERLSDIINRNGK